MSFWIPNFIRQKGGGTLVLRVGLTEIDFLFFEKMPASVQILAYGSEDISHFTVRQTLEKIFSHLPKRKRVQELVATFPENQFNAQLVHQTVPPVLPRHLIDKAEAAAIEKDIFSRASRVFQKSLFRESGILPGEFSLRQVRILDRKIDGYPVSKFDGFRRGEIVCSLLGMFLLEAPFLPVEQFAKSHKIRNMRVVHMAEAVESFAQSRSQPGIYLCVQEQRTQIIVQKEDHIAFLAAIPMGESAFKEFFGNVLGMRESTAEVFEEQYFQGSLSVAVQEKVQTHLLSEVNKFGTMVKEKLLDAKMTLPDSVWLFGKVHALRDIESIWSNEDFQDLPLAQKPATHFLLPKDIWEMNDFSGRIVPSYTTLCLLGEATL